MRKFIKRSNIAPTFSLSHLLLMYITWTLFPYEWARTLIVIDIVLWVVVFLITLFSLWDSEFVDIFKEKNNE